MDNTLGLKINQRIVDAMRDPLDYNKYCLNETTEQYVKRVKNKFKLHHGKGKRKRNKK
ncbi:MAG: hypothetical protein PHF63_00210 [Herbinix sp.]|nr:hypothetical protein [Herbinix sp.]